MKRSVEIDLTKKALIDLTWSKHAGPLNNDIDVNITVSSRKLKNEVESPSDVLFRTHQYEFRITPNEQFYNWSGRRSGFICEIKLFKRMATKENADSNQFGEYTMCGTPVINYTFTEDTFSGCWIINLIWPEEKNRISFRGDFCFRLTAFRKVDDDTFRKVFSKSSSVFKIVSKPGVYLNKMKKMSSLTKQEKTNRKQEMRRMQKETVKIPTKQPVEMKDMLMGITPPAVKNEDIIPGQMLNVQPPTITITHPQPNAPRTSSNLQPTETIPMNLPLISNIPLITPMQMMLQQQQQQQRGPVSILPKGNVEPEKRKLEEQMGQLPNKKPKTNEFFEEKQSDELISIFTPTPKITPSPSDYFAENQPVTSTNLNQERETSSLSLTRLDSPTILSTPTRLLSLSFSQDNSQEFDMTFLDSNSQPEDKKSIISQVYEALSPTSSENRFWFEKINKTQE